MKPAILPSKPHYPILDGLRGVAAVVVVMFHICEANSTSRFTQIINHGYLAVDFFFLLSGFVIGYAYDDRWNKMSIGSFFKRRLIRLQPMVVMGSIIGAMFYYTQASSIFPLIDINITPVWKVIVFMVLGGLMIPVWPAVEIRGWTETYPLNGPAWSLFYEYIANILYAIGVRKFPKWALTVLVFLSGCLLVHWLVFGPNGDAIGGWALDPTQLHVGFARLMYPFFSGLLLFRISKLTQIKHAFIWCSLLVIVALSLPRFGGEQQLWMNGLYESMVILFVFPLIIYLGASSTLANTFQKRACKFLGDISYPIYITHYPLIYLYTGWVYDNKPSIENRIIFGAVVFVAALLIAYACLKLYDEPVRKWLQQKFMPKSKSMETVNISAKLN
jgi:peptidoglycan/LPS O-acetylase OafA/YrhL